MKTFRVQIESYYEAENESDALEMFKKDILDDKYEMTVGKAPEPQDYHEEEIEEKGYYIEDGIKYSGCCGAPLLGESGICSDCKEHV